MEELFELWGLEFGGVVGYLLEGCKKRVIIVLREINSGNIFWVVNGFGMYLVLEK